MKKIIQLILLSLFISFGTFAQNIDSIKQEVEDTLKKVNQQNKIANRPGVKKEIKKPTTQKSAEEKEIKKPQEKPKADKPKADKESEKAAEEKKKEAGETLSTAPNAIAKENATNFLVKIYDRNTMKTIDGVEVYLFEMPEGKFIDTNLSFNGIASFTIDKNIEYEVRACTSGYIKRAIGILDCNSTDKAFCLRGVFHFDYGPPETEENTLLAKIKMSPIAVGQTIELDNVYYDTGRSTLRQESQKELDRLYNLMKQYSSLKIELSSHTDSRGSSASNMKLSASRAKTCYNYLLSKGISKSRIEYKGYGETRLLNECADNVKCDDKQHQKNRRTEISILEIEPEPCEPKL